VTTKPGIINSRRGITPVLSNLLLMVVAVAAMAIATTATHMITTNLRETMSERVIIEDLWFNNSTDCITVYLQNVGKIAIHVSGVYVNRTSAAFLKPFNLEIGEHKWLNISYNIVSGDLCYVNIVTTRGTDIGGYYRAP